MFPLPPSPHRPRVALVVGSVMVALSLVACELSVDPDTLGTGGGGGTVDAGTATCSEAGTGCEDPGSNNIRIRLLPGGELNGQPIDPQSPAVPITAGATIEGTVNIHVTVEADDTALVPMLFTPSWGERMNAVRSILHTCKNLDCPVAIADLAAPNVPGDYYLVFAADLQCAPCHIASGTYWQDCRSNPDCFTCGCAASACDAECMRWNDGNDLADLDEAAMCTALDKGYLPVPLWREAQYGCTVIGLTYVKLEVRP